MNRNDLSILALKISKIAKEILKQLSGKISPTFTEQYLLGILSRQLVILNDVSVILYNNQENHINSAFILLRSLLDDFLHILTIHQAEDMQEAIILIQSDAFSHRFKALQESTEINFKYFKGKNKRFFTSEKLEEEKRKFLTDSEFDKFFEDKGRFKFKKLNPLALQFKNLPNNEESAANVNAYLIYKFLSQYVHFSNLAFYLDFDPKVRKDEINQIEENLFYCFKTIVLCFHHLSETHDLNWIDHDNVSGFFNLKVENI